MKIPHPDCLLAFMLGMLAVVGDIDLGLMKRKVDYLCQKLL